MRHLFLLLGFVGSPFAAFGADEVGSLRQEREMFPDVIETITGKFIRHSPEFYQWQIKDRQGKLAAAGGNAAWQDDLAIAQAKTGSLDQAIETMLKLGKTPPDRYETHANLGLFYFLKNDFESSLAQLEKARVINPNAHAGREQYLQWLVEYRLEKPTRRAPVAPVDVKSAAPYRPRSFAIFLRTKLKKADLDLADAQAAAQGLVEIMRAGNHESMLLLEALGDVLIYSSDTAKEVARRLAARAYLRAGYLVPQPGLRKAYITLAEWALTHRAADRDNFDDAKEAMPLLTRLFTEIDDATAWYDGLKAREKEIIASSPDPEADFRRQFAEPPRVPDDPSDSSSGPRMGRIAQIAAAVGIGAVIIVIVVLTGRAIRGRRKIGAVAPNPSSPTVN
jgi:tetratricopeptide (TPR) repeat protein